MVVKPTQSRHRFSRGQVPDHRQVSAALEDRLAALGIPFGRRDLTLRLDQPLKSVEDGIRFFRLYSRDADPQEINEDFVRSRLESQDDPDYPYRLPVERQVSVLSFDVKDIPSETERSLE